MDTAQGIIEFSRTRGPFASGRRRVDRGVIIGTPGVLVRCTFDQMGSLFLDGAVNSIGSNSYGELETNFMAGTHMYDVFERWWTPYPDY
jgi:hypothetical protein